MSAIVVPRVQATLVLHPLSSGRTKPCVMLCRDEAGNDVEVVVKWRAGLDLKETGLVCELMAALLADDLDLLVPKPFIVEIETGFHRSITRPDIAELAEHSIGLNFGSRRLPAGVGTWPKDKPVPVMLRPLAAEILAFDVLTQNPDRRRDNPNLLWSGEDVFLCDHEQAFSFLAGVIGWQPPWTGQVLAFYRNHVFYQQLTGLAHNWDRFSGALDALTDGRLNEYLTAVPNEWKTNNAANRIADYLSDARHNREALFTVISRLLQ